MKHIHSFAPKRLLAAAAAGVLSVSVLLPAGNVLAAETTTDSSSETFDDGTLTYKKLSNTTVSVTDCVESATHISILPKIDGYDVVSIGDEAFANCTSLQGLTIPDTVTEIGSAAFYGCTALESLTVPDSVTKIESGTFFNCSALTDLTLGGKTTDIGDMAFGYCTSLDDYEVPFIFANFNGTQHDVEVVTHEAGHAFAAYMNRDRIPYSYVWPSMEACEVHSKSMEFFAWPWADGFFGADARKFRYSHLAGALTFIPYGTMVDHFQHIVYEHPELTPAQRHEEWKKLAAIYQPWMRLDGEIPFYGAGEYWQRQMHIYQSPFYYIDYCLAQTVSLQFWAMLQKDRAAAWAHYMAYTKQGGSRTFTELLKNAGLTTPFEESCLRSVSETAKQWLDNYDLAGIV